MLRVPNGHLLTAAVRMMNQTAAMDVPAIVDGLLEGVQQKDGMACC